MGKHLSTPGYGGSLVERAYDWLKGDIMSDRLAAGLTIDDQAIAASLGLSRTPVRGAIQMLRVEGFVEVIPRKGSRVAQITLEGLREVYQALTALEIESIVLAATRRPSEQEPAPLRKAVTDMVAALPPRIRPSASSATSTSTAGSSRCLATGGSSRSGWGCATMRSGRTSWRHGSGRYRRLLGRRTAK